ncbi:MAG: hypothetical protein WBE60_03790 [Nitrosotalea sp.]
MKHVIITRLTNKLNSSFRKNFLAYAVTSMMFFLFFSQSVSAEPSGLNAISLISVYQPIDVAADSNHVFVIHRTCALQGDYEYGFDMTGASVCPGFTAYDCSSYDFQSEILSIDNSGTQTIIASLPAPFGCQQTDHLAISSGLGGFPTGYIYLAQGTWGQVDIWKIGFDGKTSLFETNLPPLGPDVYITFDRTGSFGYDMIVTGGDQVWKINSNGKSSQVAEIPIRESGHDRIGSAVVAPSSFGTYGGDILVPDPGTGNIFAVSPQNNVTKIGLWPGASEILFVPQPMCSFGSQETAFLSSLASDTGGSIAMYPKTEFSGLGGSALLTNQYNPSIGLMTATANGIMIKEFQSNIDTQLLEGSTFVLC